MDSEVFSRDPFSRKDAWLWLIENAQWEDGKKLQRGQIEVRQMDLAATWKWTRSKVVRWIEAAQEANMIRTTSSTTSTIITICNYEKYQSDEAGTEQKNGQRSDNDRTTTGQPNIKKEEIRSKNNSPYSPPHGEDLFQSANPEKSIRQKGSRIPSEWKLTDDLLAMATSQGLSVSEANEQAVRFVDYWKGASGAKAVKVDWDATWRNWVRRSRDYGAKKNGSSNTKALHEMTAEERSQLPDWRFA